MTLTASDGTLDTWPPLTYRRGTLRDRFARVAEAATTPLVPADFLDLFAPAARRRRPARPDRRRRAARPRDAATIVHQARCRLGRPRARTVRPDRHRRRRRPPVARLLAHPRPPRRRPDLDHRQGGPDGKVSNHLVHEARPGTLVQLEQAAGEFVLAERARQAALRHRRLRHHPGHRDAAQPVPGHRPGRRAPAAQPRPRHRRRARRPQPSPTRSSSRTSRRSTPPAAIRLVARYDDQHGVARRRRPRRRWCPTWPSARRSPAARTGCSTPSRRTTPSRACRCSPSSSAPPASSPARAAPSPSEDRHRRRGRRRHPDPRRRRGRRRADAERLPDGHLLRLRAAAARGRRARPAQRRDHHRRPPARPTTAACSSRPASAPPPAPCHIDH